MRSHQGARVSNSSSSLIADLFRDREFRLDWDNDFGFHVARNVQELRRLRGLTQEGLAGLIGSAQPKVAVLESGDANVTLKTISKYVSALCGRLRFEIEPAELEHPRLPPWWQWPEFQGGAPDKGWSCKVRLNTQSGSGTQVVAGWESYPTQDDRESLSEGVHVSWEDPVGLLATGSKHAPDAAINTSGVLEGSL